MEHSSLEGQVNKIRILIAKPGLDGHETGARLIARAFRDAGMEVIYTGARQTVEMIVNTAIEEDVDVIGLSILSGIHKEAASDVLSLLKERGSEHIPVVIGGIIPYNDIPKLKQIGIRQVWGPGSDTREMVTAVRELVKSEE